jgi:NAD-dependent SIR2 family protein deacetylase
MGDNLFCEDCKEKYQRDFLDDYDEPEFIPCDKCDGHPACEDYGCAYELGLGRMVRKNIEPGNDNW